MPDKKGKLVAINPRDFIRPPYIACPKCGNGGSFGVLMINDHGYRRRCTECWHSEAYDLPVLDKKVIYLDQFVISNMMLAINQRLGKTKDVDPFYLVLFEKIDLLCKLQQVVCPESEFHRMESVVHTDRNESLKQMYEYLSGDVSFYDAATVRRFQITQKFREVQGLAAPNEVVDTDEILQGSRNVWQEWFHITVQTLIADDEVDAIRANRGKTEQSILDLFHRWQSESSKTFTDWYQEEVTQYGPGVLHKYHQTVSDYGRLQAGKITDYEQLVDVLLNEESVLITGLLDVLPDDMDNETKRQIVFEFLQSEHMYEVPYIKIAAAELAALAHDTAHASKGRKPPTRGTAADMNMIATLLPYCDAIFVDNEMRRLLSLKEAGQVLGEYVPNVFSLSNKEEFLVYLQTLLDAVPPDHLQRVREVYGDSWERPFYEMYEANE